MKISVKGEELAPVDYNKHQFLKLVRNMDSDEAIYYEVGFEDNGVLIQNIEGGFIDFYSEVNEPTIYKDYNELKVNMDCWGDFSYFKTIKKKNIVIEFME